MSSLGRRVRLVPLPLAFLIAAGVALTLTWISVQPPWIGPDESGHFAYVQRMVEQREVPWFIHGHPESETTGTSSEVGTAVVQMGARAMDGNYAMKDVTRHPDEVIWEEAEAQLPSEAKSNTAYMATMLNPPLYPLYEAVPYAATSGLDVFSRLYVLRLWNIPLVIAVIVSAWVFTGLIVGERRTLQVLGTAIAMLNAQFVAVSGFVNADALITALYSVAFALMALVLLRGPTRGRVIALVAVAVAAGLTHGRGLPLLLPVALTLAIAWWRATRPHGRRARLGALAAGIAGAAVTALVVVRVATGSLTDFDKTREFLSYLWQFYLPRPGFMEQVAHSDWGVRDVYIDRFWGTSPQLDAMLAPWLIDLMSTISQIGLVAFLVVLAVRWRTTRRAGALGVVLLITFVGYLLAMHVAGYRSIASGSTDTVLTGRYLIPFVVLLGGMVAVGVSWLPRRALPVVASVLVFGALALHYASFGALMVRFHA